MGLTPRELYNYLKLALEPEAPAQPAGRSERAEAGTDPHEPTAPAAVAASAAPMGPRGGPGGKGSAPGKFPKGDSGPKGNCFYCKKPGHIAKNCFKAQRKSRSGSSQSSVASSAMTVRPQMPYAPMAMPMPMGGQHFHFTLNIPPSQPTMGAWF